MCDKCFLSNLKINEKGIIISLENSGDIRQRLIDLGFVNNTIVECVGTSPSGDPAAYFIRGTVISLRKIDAEKIIIKRL